MYCAYVLTLQIIVAQNERDKNNRDIEYASKLQCLKMMFAFSKAKLVQDTVWLVYDVNVANPFINGYRSAVGLLCWLNTGPSISSGTSRSYKPDLTGIYTHL